MIGSSNLTEIYFWPIHHRFE